MERPVVVVEYILRRNVGQISPIS